MPSVLTATALLLALGQMPDGTALPVGPATAYPEQMVPQPYAGGYQGPAGAYNVATYGSGPFANSYGNYRLNPGMGGPGGPGGNGVADELYNYDHYNPWVHGYWQELPAFGGYAYFRPYNYRHVYVQSEVAANWGSTATMPYSQEYYRRAREQGTMEQRTTGVSGSRFPGFAYRQKPRTAVLPQTIAQTSAERTQPQPPARRPAPAARPLFGSAPSR
jgi:hypothetical protein